MALRLLTFETKEAVLPLFFRNFAVWFDETVETVESANERLESARAIEGRVGGEVQRERERQREK